MIRRIIRSIVCRREQRVTWFRWQLAQMNTGTKQYFPHQEEVASTR